jgi:hypothetical protein
MWRNLTGAGVCAERSSRFLLLFKPFTPWIGRAMNHGTCTRFCVSPPCTVLLSCECLGHRRCHTLSLPSSRTHCPQPHVSKSCSTATTHQQADPTIAASFFAGLTREPPGARAAVQEALGVLAGAYQAAVQSKGGDAGNSGHQLEELLATSINSDQVGACMRGEGGEEPPAVATMLIATMLPPSKLQAARWCLMCTQSAYSADPAS